MARLAGLIAGCAAWAWAAQAAPPSVPPPNSPALSALGAFAVGRTTYALPETRDGRKLRLLIWYPAEPTSSPAKPYQWLIAPAPPLRSLTVSFEAIAHVDARPLPDRSPLAILSHGFGGAPEHLTYLGENLASKGYVVAGIDHADPTFSDPAGFQRAFGQAAAYRGKDQQRALQALLAPSDKSMFPKLPPIDGSRVAVIGYSMGGFGALATAGAGYDPTSVAVKSLPEGALSGQLQGRTADKNIKAVVAIAPWGAQGPYRAWSEEGAASLTLPLLLITGDADDVSNHADGAKWLFERARGSDRTMLVYKNARHNVGGNPTPVEARGSAEYHAFFEEPVWRSDRLNALNVHFITAFLELHVSGRKRAKDMLTPPTAGGEWPGFPRRTALGFEVLHRAAGE